MTSINTNRAAMTALQSLNATNMKLEATQQRISTGLRVSTATDNAAYWSIATTMRSDNSSLSTVKDADRVVVIDGGRVVESGRHDELVALDGVYRRLVERQFAVG